MARRFEYPIGAIIIDNGAYQIDLLYNSDIQIHMIIQINQYYDKEGIIRPFNTISPTSVQFGPPSAVGSPWKTYSSNNQVDIPSSIPNN